MCLYCNPDSETCQIFYDKNIAMHYLSVNTYHWDDYDDGYEYIKIYIGYCPYCGRKLKRIDLDA